MKRLIQTTCISPGFGCSRTAGPKGSGRSPHLDSAGPVKWTSVGLVFISPIRATIFVRSVWVVFVDNRDAPGLSTLQLQHGRRADVYIRVNTTNIWRILLPQPWPGRIRG
jgi:hypothetical protein